MPVFPYVRLVDAAALSERGRAFQHQRLDGLARFLEQIKRALVNSRETLNNEGCDEDFASRHTISLSSTAVPCVV
jgi:hypothetical protein